MEEENIIQQDLETSSVEDALCAQLEELKNKHLYDLAELQNSFNRRVKNAELAANRAVEKLILEILEPVDDLERVILYLSQKLTDSELAGISHVYKKVLGVLRSAGCEQVQVATGDEFSPTDHEAVTVTPGDRAGIVAAILRNGYRYNGVLVRPVKVAVTAVEDKNEKETGE